MEARIKEIFESIQGEGPLIGYKQLFIRFCGCNLACDYCDTNFESDNSVLFTAKDLAEKIKNKYDLEKVNSVSLTGGEPLLYADFIKEFLYFIPNTKIYLETNATLSENLLKIKDEINVISADIKLPSATGKDTFLLHDKFLANCNGVYTFAKIVFDNNITDDEIKKCSDLGQKYDIELILQPKMLENTLCINNKYCQKVLDKFLFLNKKTRLIPQTHKFLDIR